ncbi:hypothetical protein [Nocardia sp. NPDC057455]
MTTLNAVARKKAEASAEELAAAELVEPNDRSTAQRRGSTSNLVAA